MSGTGVLPAQLPCLPWGRFWDEAKRVLCWGKGRILSLAPHLPQAPGGHGTFWGSVGPSQRGQGTLGGPKGHLASPKMT